MLRIQSTKLGHTKKRRRRKKEKWVNQVFQNSTHYYNNNNVKIWSVTISNSWARRVIWKVGRKLSLHYRVWKKLCISSVLTSYMKSVTIPVDETL